MSNKDNEELSQLKMGVYIVAGVGSVLGKVSGVVFDIILLFNLLIRITMGKCLPKIVANKVAEKNTGWVSLNNVHICLLAIV